MASIYFHWYETLNARIFIELTFYTKLTSKSDSLLARNCRFPTNCLLFQRLFLNEQILINFPIPIQTFRSNPVLQSIGQFHCQSDPQYSAKMCRKLVKMLHKASGIGTYYKDSAKTIRLVNRGCTNRPFFHIIVQEVCIVSTYKYLFLSAGTNELNRTNQD